MVPRLRRLSSSAGQPRAAGRHTKKFVKSTQRNAKCTTCKAHTCNRNMQMAKKCNLHAIPKSTTFKTVKFQIANAKVQGMRNPHPKYATKQNNEINAKCLLHMKFVFYSYTCTLIFRNLQNLTSLSAHCFANLTHLCRWSLVTVASRPIQNR